MTRQEHWEAVYTEKSDQEVSWHQADPRLSTELITEACNDRTASIIDVGGARLDLSSNYWMPDSTTWQCSISPGLRWTGRGREGRPIGDGAVAGG